MFLPPRKCDSVDPTEWRSTAQVQPLRAVKKGKRRERETIVHYAMIYFDY